MPRSCSFQQLVQDSTCPHYRKSHINEQNFDNKMSLVIEDDKYHLNYNIFTYNFRLTRNLHYNRVRLVCRATTLNDGKMIIRSECETIDDNAIKGT